MPHSTVSTRSNVRDAYRLGQVVTIGGVLLSSRMLALLAHCCELVVTWLDEPGAARGQRPGLH